MPYYDASTRSKEQMRFRPPGARHTQNVWGLNGPGSGPEQDAYIEQQKRDLYGKGIRYTGLEGGGSRFGAEALPNFGSKRSIWDPVEKIKDYDFGPDIDARKAAESEIRTYQDMLAANPSSKQFSKFGGMGASLWGGGMTPDVKEKYEYGTPASPDYGPMMELASMVNPSNISTEEARNFYGVAAPVLGSKRAESFLKPFTEAEKAMTTAGQKDMDAIRKGLETSYRPYLENNPALVPLFNEAYRTGDDSKLQAAITGGTVKTKLQAKADAAVKNIQDTGEYTPEAIAVIGEYFKQTGILPPLGMKGGGIRAAVFDYVATGRLPGGTPVNTGNLPDIANPAAAPKPTTDASPIDIASDIASNKANYASDAKSLANLQKGMDTVMAFEGDVRNSMNIVSDLVEKMDMGRFPGVNKLNLLVRYHSGDPDVQAYKLAVTNLMLEYMKVKTAGTGISAAELSVGAQERANEILTSADSPATIKQMMDVMSQEMEAKRSSFESQLGAIQGRIGGGSEQTGETGAGMAEMPDAAAYRGQRMIDDDTGQIYESDGTKWNPVQ